MGLWLLAALALLWSAAPMDAQQALPRDTTITESIEESDPALPGGNRYDEYLFQARRGDRVRVRVSSAQFDAFLLWGSGTAADFAPAEGDDDSAGGTNAELGLTIIQEGRYSLRVTAFDSAGRGTYGLEVQTAAADTAAPAGIQKGQRVQGFLDAPVGEEGQGDLYVYHATPGQSLEIALQSADFDPVLRLSTIEEGEGVARAWETIERSNPRARLAFGEATTVLVEVAAQPSAGAEEGSYMLTIGAQAAAAYQAPTPPSFVHTADGKHWILQTPMVYRVGTTRDSVIVPAGFVTDRASIPYIAQWLIPKDGRHTLPAVVHDYLYWTRTCSQAEADRLFLHAMVETRSPPWRRNLIYKAVARFGARAYAENLTKRDAGNIRILPQPSACPAIEPGLGRLPPHLAQSARPGGFRTFRFLRASVAAARRAGHPVCVTDGDRFRQRTGCAGVST